LVTFSLRRIGFVPAPDSDIV